MKFLIIMGFALLMSVSAHIEWSAFNLHSRHTLRDSSDDPQVNVNFTDIVDKLANNKPTPPAEANREYWLKLAREEVDQRTKSAALNLNRAKNIIFFLGDGMSLNTVTAARIRKGQLKGNAGEEDQLSFEKFPYTALSKTYCTDSQVADSACTSTAYMCGVKANILTLGVTAAVRYNNCTESMNPANQVSSILSWAQKAGKATGFITTTTLTHASPGGGYAHVASRMWESDTDITKHTQGTVDPSQCMDIAQQLVLQEPGSKLDIMLGGGMGKFLPKTIKDMHGNMGERSDGKNLLSMWQAKHHKGLVVTDRIGLGGFNHKMVSNVMGLFQSKYMDFHAVADAKEQPTLEEMTEVAIQYLNSKKKGYVIFIEGGLIDIAHHATQAGLGIDETLEFDKAVDKARAITDPHDTLVVVTADHAHPLSIAGYPGRGTDILGLNQHDEDANGLRYATLNYATGPQQYLDGKGKRVKLEGTIDSKDPLVRYPSYIDIESGAHAGDDVGVYASGPYEHLFNGVMQQSTLPHLMAYAACIGDGPTMCKKIIKREEAESDEIL